MVAFGVLLVLGIWIAVNPEHMLRILREFGPAMERFNDALRFGTPYFNRIHRVEWRPESREMRVAMRAFGVTIAAAGFLGFLSRLV